MMGQTPLEAALGADVQRALLLGTHRIALDAPAALKRSEQPGENWPLAAAALTALAIRSQKAEIPAWVADNAAVDDSRPIVPSEARAALLRVALSGSSPAEDEFVHTSLALALKRARLALHPFDVPRLSRLIANDAFVPGPREIAFLAFRCARVDQADGAAQGDVLEPSLSELQRERQRDPSAARASIATALVGAPAQRRVQLVKLLQFGLSAGDLSILEPLRTDGARSVRDAVQGLLTRIPGTSEAQGHLAEVIGALQVERDGATLQRVSLRIPEPARRSGSALFWALETFTDLPLDALTAGLDTSRLTLARAAAEDAVLQTVLLALALDDGTVEPEFATALPSASFDALLLREAGRSPAERTGASVVPLLRPSEWTELPALEVLRALQRAAGGPLPLELREALATAPATMAFFEQCKGAPLDDAKWWHTAPAVALALAALAPGPQLRAQLEGAPVTLGLRALALLHALEQIGGAAEDGAPR